MNIGWWQGGIHIEPESKKDRLALRAISEVLGLDKSLAPGRYMIEEIERSDIVTSTQGDDQKSVIGIEEPGEKTG